MTSPRRRAPSTTLASTMSVVRARPTRVPAALALASSRVSTSHPAKRRASCACRGVPRQHWATQARGLSVPRGGAAGRDGGPTSAAHLVRRRSAPRSRRSLRSSGPPCAMRLTDPGSPFVSLGDLVRRERAVLCLVLADCCQAGPDSEFLPRGLGDPSAVAIPAAWAAAAISASSSPGGMEIERFLRTAMTRR